MKKNYITILATLLIGFTAKSQNTVGFEDLPLALDTFWNGSDQSGQFTSNTVQFNNQYDTAWGGSWRGISYSTMTDTMTAGYSNQYSCISGSGAGNSKTYAVSYSSLSTPVIEFPSGSSVDGIWVNNSTYAYLSMKNGDSFAKKFGDSTDASGISDGTNGNDWFKLTIYGTNSDSVEFYLADYRGASSADYIIKDWTYVSLSGLSSSSDKLSFRLSSSDVGTYGMNTPSFFCLDSLSFSAPVSISENKANSWSTYPNPTIGKTKVNFGEQTSGIYSIYNYAGKEISRENFNSVSSINLDLTNQPNGMYVVSIVVEGKVYTKKIIKN